MYRGCSCPVHLERGLHLPFRHHYTAALRQQGQTFTEIEKQDGHSDATELASTTLVAHAWPDGSISSRPAVQLRRHEQGLV